MPTSVPDERLRLIFTCCHPALAREAQVALTLRLLGGLIDRRGRARVPGRRADDGAAAGAGEGEDPRGAASRSGSRPTTALPARLEAVLDVLYLVFNEGYAASAGDALIRRSLCAEALRLAEVVAELMPDGARRRSACTRCCSPTTRGARRASTPTARSCCSRTRIAAAGTRGRSPAPPGSPPARCGSARPGATCCRPRSRSSTQRPDGRRRRAGTTSSPSTRTSPLSAPIRSSSSTAPWRSRWRATYAAAWPGSTRSRPRSTRYHYFHAARADLLRRQGEREPAIAAYARAFELAGNGAERAFLRAAA